jgi:hypothetical protein
MRTISEVYVANTPVEYGIPGTRLEILSAPGTVTVSLRDANNVEITNGLASNLDPGSYMVPDGGFKRFQITSSANGTVKFLVSYGEGGTRSVAGVVAIAGTVAVSGTVDVINAGRTRTLAQQAFIAHGLVAAFAAQYSAVQLWNPAASGKNIYVEQMMFYTSGALANGAVLRTSSPSGALGNLFAGTPQSKKVGGVTASVAQLRWAANAALLGDQTLCVVPSSNRSFIPTEPFLITPGTGIMLINQTLNENLGPTFEYFEENV